MAISDVAFGLSSAVIWVFGIVYLRWIPAHHFLPILFGAFAINVSTILLDPILAGSTRDSNRTKSASEISKSVRPIAPASTVRRRKAPRSFVLVFPVNVVLVLLALDFTFSLRYLHASNDLVFSRVGYVAEDSAKILVRDYQATSAPLSIQYRQSNQSTLHDWKTHHAAYQTADSTDYTVVFELQGLRVNTTYEYLISNNLAGKFKTATTHSSAHVVDEPFTFLHSSCIIPNFPYQPFRHHLAIPGFKHLAKRLPELKAKFMLFLGDFIYIDVPIRFGTDKETYRREYRQVYASPDWHSVTQQNGAELPWIHVLDDHEIANDWDKNETGLYNSAADPWQHYQVAVNPRPHRTNTSYFSFSQGPASFFLMDTRRYRTPFDGSNGTWTDSDTTKSMLGETQRRDLINWLLQEPSNTVKWKVVVSSIPFTKNWRFGSEDTWAGYLGERQVILEAMWETSSRYGIGVIVVSGDRHEFAATAFPPPITGPNAMRWPADSTVLEFSASPLSMFYLPVRTYRQEDDEDLCLKYLPDGNSKFGAITIRSSPLSEQSTLYYQLFIDGAEVWTHTLTTPFTRPRIQQSGGVLSWFKDKPKPHVLDG